MSNSENLSNNKTSNPASRIIPIGDIHGCYDELVKLIDYIEPTPSDTLVFLGDYIDRGINSKAVLDLITELNERCTTIVLLGNHESMMREAFNLNHSVNDRLNCVKFWQKNGGADTLNSYMFNIEDLYSPHFDESYIPDNIKTHLAFIESMVLYHETESHIFVHATPFPDKPMEEQDEIDLVWRRAGRVDAQHNYTHISGKVIVSGHTAQGNGLPLELSAKNIIIDSGCVWTGWLTAMSIHDNNYIQASKTEIRVIGR